MNHGSRLIGLFFIAGGIAGCQDAGEAPPAVNANVPSLAPLAPKQCRQRVASLLASANEHQVVTVYITPEGGAAEAPLVSGTPYDAVQVCGQGYSIVDHSRTPRL